MAKKKNNWVVEDLDFDDGLETIYYEPKKQNKDIISTGLDLAGGLVQGGINTIGTIGGNLVESASHILKEPKAFVENGIDLSDPLGTAKNYFTTAFNTGIDAQVFLAKGFFGTLEGVADFLQYTSADNAHAFSEIGKMAIGDNPISDLYGGYAKWLKGNAEFDSTAALIGQDPENSLFENLMWAKGNNLEKLNQNIKKTTGKDLGLDKPARVFTELGYLNDEGKTHAQVAQDYSILGSTGESIFEGIGNIGAMAAMSAVGGELAGAAGLTTSAGELSTLGKLASSGIPSYTSAYGNARTKAYKDGASDSDARKYATISGFAEAISEQFFDAMPGVKSANILGKRIPIKSAITDRLEKSFGSNVGKLFLKFAGGLEEGSEEIISNVLVTLGSELLMLDKNYQYNPDNLSGDVKQDIVDTFLSQESWDAFFSAGFTSALLGGGEIARDTATRNQIINAYAKDNNMSFKEAKQLLTGETLESTKQGMDRADYDTNVEFNEAAEKRILNYMEQHTGENIESRIEDLIKVEEQNKGIEYSEEDRAKLAEKIRKDLIDRTNNPDKYSSFRMDEASEEEKNSQLYKDFNRLANNTKESHKLYNFYKALKGRNENSVFELTNNEELVKEGYLEKKDGKYGRTIDGKFVEEIPNGINLGNKILINADGLNAFEATTWHEIAHSIKDSSPKGYNELKQIVKDYYGENDYQKYEQKYRDLYGDSDLLEDEYVNDKLGEMLNNEDFIERISGNQSLLQTLINKIKRTIKYMTSGKEQKRLMKLQDQLEKKYTELYGEAKFEGDESLPFYGGEDARYSLSEGLEEQGYKVLEQAENDRQAMIQNFKEYLDENDITNPTEQDIDNSIIDILGYDNEELDKSDETYKKYKETIYKYLDTQDLIEELKSVGANVDEDGYVTLYHQTSNENAQKIRESGNMTSAGEDYIFFSTSPNAQQAAGRGQTKLEFKIPADEIELDDIFSDNADVKIKLDGKGNLDVSQYLKQQPRYSLSVQEANAQTNNYGQPLTEGQKEYFKDSKAVNEDGELIEVFHTMTDRGTQFNEFNPVGTLGYRFGDQVVTYYTDNQAMSTSYAGGDQVRKAYSKPLETIDDVKEYIDFINKETNDTLKVNGITNNYEIVEEDGKYVLTQKPQGKEFLGYANLSDEGKVALDRVRNNDNLHKVFLSSDNPAQEVVKQLRAWYDTRQYDGYPELAEILEMYDRETSKLIASQNKYSGQSIIRTAFKTDLEEYLFGTRHIGDEQFLDTYRRNLYKTYESEQDLIDNIQKNFESKYQYGGYVNITNPYVINTYGENWNSVVTERDVAKSEEYNNLVDTIEKKTALTQLAEESRAKHFDYTDGVNGLDYTRYKNIWEKVTNRDLRDVIENTSMFGGDYNSWIEAGKKNAELFGEQYVQDVPNGNELLSNYVKDLNTTEESIIKDMTIEDFVSKYSKAYENEMNYGNPESYFRNHYREITGKPLENIDTKKFYDMAYRNFDYEAVDNVINKRLTTNDIVNKIIESNKSGETNYDGIIMKDVYDYGSNVEGFKTTGNLYVTFNSEQFKLAGNENPTSNKDIRYSLSTNEDTELNELSKGQMDYFKNTKAVDKNGYLEIVYHGTPHDFTIFDITKAGETGLAYGNGFYFTNSRGTARGFTEGGMYGDTDEQIKEGYVNIEKPASYDEKTMTYDEFKALYEALNKNPNMYDEEMGMSNIDALLSDYGDIYNDKQKVIKNYYDSYDTDVNLIDNLSYIGNPTEFYKVLRDTTGYDGVIIDNPNSYDAFETYFIAYNPDQFKLASNKNPTNDVDMRFSLARDEQQRGYGTYSEDIAIPTIDYNLPTTETIVETQNVPVNERTTIEDRLAEQRRKLADKRIKTMIEKQTYKSVKQATKIAKDYLGFDSKETQQFREGIEDLARKRKDNLIKAENYQEVKDLVGQYANRDMTFVSEELKEAQKDVRHTQLIVSDDLKDQITDWTDFRKKSGLNIKKGQKSNVDVVYQEFCDMYPGMFDDTITNYADQLQAMSEFVHKDNKFVETYTLSDETLNQITNKVWEKLSQNALTKQDFKNIEDTINKQVERRTREVVRNALLDEMGITLDDIDVGKDITSIAYQRTDPKRLNEKVFGYDIGQKVNDATVNFVGHQEAERTRFLNNERNDVENLGIKARSKESAAVQKYGEKQYVNDKGELVEYNDRDLMSEFPRFEDQQKIKNAAKALRAKYDEYIDLANDKLVELGYDPIPKRQDYFKHFTELQDKFSQWGIPFSRENLTSEELSTDINGLTDQFKPGKNFFASAMERKGIKTTYDAITGIDSYLEGISNLIYHTESIQRYRALSKMIRDTYGQTHGLENLDTMTEEEAAKRVEDVYNNKLTRYAAWLDEQANSLAGKKGAIDRSMERFMGRKAYTFLNALKSQVGSNMTGFNVRSAMTNFASAIQGASKTQKISFLEGTAFAVKNYLNEDSDLINKSDFLTRRFGSDALSQKTWQKISAAGQVFMSATDRFTSLQIWGGKYYEGLNSGLTQEAAIKQADDFAARIMGDRSKGQTAEIFNSKTLGLLTQFQLEVNNQWSSMMHDNKMEMQKNPGLKTSMKIVGQLGQLYAFSYMFNGLMKALTGSDVMFDPIEILKGIIAPDDEDEEKTLEERATEAIGKIINQLPMASIFTGGRIPISEAFTGVGTLAKKLTGQKDNYGNEYTWDDVKDDLIASAFYYLLPTGYGQIKKTAQGLGQYGQVLPEPIERAMDIYHNENLPIAGNYTKAGKLKYEADTSTFGKIQSGLFGRNASANAVEYREMGYSPLSEKKAQEAYDANLPISEYRRIDKGIKDAAAEAKENNESQSNAKAEYIYNLPLKTDQKNILVNGALNRKNPIDMTDYGKYGSLEEFDYANKNPEKYLTLTQIADYDSYQEYEDVIQKLKKAYTDKNARKRAIHEYIDSLNLNMYQKLMLENQAAGYSIKNYKSQVRSYIDSLNLSAQDKQKIDKELFGGK